MKIFSRTNWRRRLGLALLIGLLMALAAVPAFAQTAPTATVTAPRLSVRTGPGASYTRITSVGQGESVSLLGRDSASAWAKIRTAGGVEGWASTYFLDTDARLSDLTVLAKVQPQVQIAPVRLNVRSGPGLAYAAIASLPSGEVVNVVGRSADSAWLYVHFGGDSLGWIGSAEITPTMSLRWLTVTDAAGVPGSGVTVGSTPLASGFTGVARGGYPPIRVNTADSDDHGIITYLEAGETVQVLGRNTASTWLYIFFRGNTLGWVAAPDVNTSFALSSLPAVSPQETPVGENQQPPSGVTPITIPTVTPAPSPTGDSGVVITARLNVRSGPGPGYAVIDVVVREQVLAILGRDSAGAWLQVKTPSGKTGWVSALYINESGDVATIPVEAPYDAVALVTTGALNMRTGPGPEYARIKVVYQNDYLTLTGRTFGGSWLRVVADGVEGWVDASFVQTGYDIDALPVIRIEG